MSYDISTFILRNGQVSPRTSRFREKRENGWAINCRMSPIGSTNKMLVPSGVATGRGDFNLSSSISTGDENPPLMEVSFYREMEGLYGYFCHTE